MLQRITHTVDSSAPTPPRDRGPPSAGRCVSGYQRRCSHARSPRALARAADLVLVPCRPSVLDLRAVTASQDIARLAGTPAAAVLCAVPARGPLAGEAQSALEAYGLPVAPVRIGQRAAFVHAMTTGQGAQEYEQAGKAAREIARLYGWTHAQASQPDLLTGD